MNGFDGNLSSVDFGEPIVSNMKGNSSVGLVNLPMGNDFFWSINVQAFSAGTETTNNAQAFS